MSRGKKKVFTRGDVVEVRRNYPTSPWVRAVYQRESPVRGHRAWHNVKIEGVNPLESSPMYTVPVNRIRKALRKADS